MFHTIILGGMVGDKKYEAEMAKFLRFWPRDRVNTGVMWKPFGTSLIKIYGIQKELSIGIDRVFCLDQ